MRADGGVTINGLVRWTVSHGLAGLEAWAGTPGTVGGAVHGNAHFRGRLISELIASASLLSRRGELRAVPAAAMEFGYDTSRLQRTGEILVSADFVVSPGDPEQLRATARESLAFRKRTQPLASPSAGCIFQNPDPARDAVPDGIPMSAGALVDRAGLKNAAEGRGSRLADPRQFHRERRGSDRRVDQGADRALQERRSRPVRGRASGRDRLSGCGGESAGRGHE